MGTRPDSAVGSLPIRRPAHLSLLTRVFLANASVLAIVALLLLFSPIEISFPVTNTGFLVSACSEPDPQMAELQRIYAEKGEGTPPAVKKVAKRNTQQGTTPYLSTTNSPLSTTNSPLSTTNSPAKK